MNARTKNPARKASDWPTATPTERYLSIVDEATTAANQAGDEWMAAAQARGPTIAVVGRGEIVGTLLDVCGIVYIRITDRRTAFARWLKKQNPDHRLYSFHIRHKYEMRQEMGLGEACYGAALKVLRSHGIEGVELYARAD